MTRAVSLVLRICLCLVLVMCLVKWLMHPIPAVVSSTLHRLLVDCGDLRNFVAECAEMIKCLVSDNGFKLQRVWYTLKRFVCAKLHATTERLMLCMFWF